MSRFYEVLKAASRFGSNGKDNHDGVEWDSLGFLPAELPSGPEPPTVVSQAGPDSADRFGVETPDQIMAEVTGETLVHTAPLGSPVRVSFDTVAPVLPNAFEKHVIENYRRLRTKILQQQETMPMKIIVVTSPAPQEGKTVTAVNLALSFAMLSSFRMLVVDGDLRRASLSHLFRTTERPGLGNVLDGSARLEDAIYRAEEGAVYFLPAGTSQAPSTELLQVSLGSLFRRLGEHFDLVLVDSPPVNLIADVQLLVANSDAVILVARAFKTTRRALEKAAQDLQGARILGTVLNGGTPIGRYGGYGAYKGYY
jgi:capsular exopolysaccharide synthesis family protein